MNNSSLTNVLQSIGQKRADSDLIGNSEFLPAAALEQGGCVFITEDCACFRIELELLLARAVEEARASGDGTFYLKVNVWPAGTERVELRKQWIVMAGPFDGGPAGE